jgi:hypothetical protein
MYPIEIRGATEEFTECWISAGKHLENQSSKLRWLRTHLSPLFIEHLSFFLGNQMFFIQLFDIDGLLETPNNNIPGLISLAREANAIPCLLPMKKVSNEWQPQGKNWCLVEPITKLSISPEKLVTTEKIEMSDWEVQDLAVTGVKKQLEKDGKKIMSWNSYPDVNPSIWFYDETGIQYVIVCSGRHPQKEVSMPEDIESMKEEFQVYGVDHSTFKTVSVGYFVSVIVADAVGAMFDGMETSAVSATYDDTNGNFLPLIRGLGLSLRWNTKNLSGEVYEGSAWATVE